MKYIVLITLILVSVALGDEEEKAESRKIDGGPIITKEQLAIKQTEGGFAPESSKQPMLTPQQFASLSQQQQQLQQQQKLQQQQLQQHQQQQLFRYQQLGLGARNPGSIQLPTNPVPGGVYQQTFPGHPIQVNPAQTQQVLPGQAQQAHSTILGVYTHPKEAAADKKPILGKDPKNTYSKESSYATVPDQPGTTANTARFVADPTRSHMIEEVPESTLQQLAYRPQQQFVQGSQQFPVHLNFAGNAAAMQDPYNHYITVSPNQLQKETKQKKHYKQTEHGFMDRVWGEVQTVRETITTDIFGAIPNFFRNIWSAIVGAVSTASARMLQVDWVSVLDIVRKQLE